MNIFKAFKRNDDLIVKGAKFVLGETAEGKEIYFRIARAHESYPDFQSAVQDGLEKNKRALDSLDKTDKKAESKLRTEIVMSAFVSTCIKGWENVQAEDGTDLVYSEDAIKALAELPELIEEMFKFASTDKNYVGDFDAQGALKN